MKTARTVQQVNTVQEGRPHHGSVLLDITVRRGPPRLTSTLVVRASSLRGGGSQGRRTALSVLKEGEESDWVICHLTGQRWWSRWHYPHVLLLEYWRFWLVSICTEKLFSSPFSHVFTVNSHVNPLVYHSLWVASVTLLVSNNSNPRYCTGSEDNVNNLPMCSKGKYCERQTAAGHEQACPKGWPFLASSHTSDPFKIV